MRKTVWKLVDSKWVKNQFIKVLDKFKMARGMILILTRGNNGHNMISEVQIINKYCDPECVRSNQTYFLIDKVVEWIKWKLLEDGKVHSGWSQGQRRQKYGTKQEIFKLLEFNYILNRYNVHGEEVFPLHFFLVMKFCKNVLAPYISWGKVNPENFLKTFLTAYFSTD